MEILRIYGYESQDHQIGVWRNRATGGQVDFLVPEAMSGDRGRRAARLTMQEDRLARRTVGIEGVVVDNGPMEIRALEDGDLRNFVIAVAGAAALLVATLTKLEERQTERRRVNDKDAIDVGRLLRSVPTDVLAVGIVRLLHDPRSAGIANKGLDCLRDLFTSATGAGIAMAVRGLDPLELLEVVSTSTLLLAGDLLRGVKRRQSLPEAEG